LDFRKLGIGVKELKLLEEADKVIEFTLEQLDSI
jgi:hypothetical protein